MNAKEQIIDMFRKNVKGKKPDVTGSNAGHDGKYGHWLERQFGIIANGDNEADLLGYELKNETTSKTSFGDWSANVYIFDLNQYRHLFAGTTKTERRDSFMHIFGKRSERVAGRFSWSGEPCPKIDGYNHFGQILKIEDGNKDIVAIYSYSHDLRPDKASIVPAELQHDDVVLARWYGLSSPAGGGKCLKDKVEDKFNDKGWFTCKTDARGCYTKICFGNPVDYESFLSLVRSGTAFFDSGMHTGNARPYSMWRMNNNIWNSLIVDEYE